MINCFIQSRNLCLSGLCWFFPHFACLYHFRISLGRIIEADIAAAVVLISMGALLGRTTPIQLLVMALIEIVVYASNEYFQLELVKVMNGIVVRIS